MTSSILTEKDIRHVANLIKIYIPKEELKKYEDQLNKVLSYLEVFEELETKNVPITSQVTGLTNVFRKDESQESLSQQEALSNTNSKKNGFFVVKKVLSNK